MLICVDAGHGGEDHGGQSLGLPEKEIALLYALGLAEELRKRGCAVVLTRDSDQFVPLSERAAIANEARADLFVSIHANASSDPRSRGPWSIHAAPSEKGREVATQLQGALHRTLGGRANAVYPDQSPWVGNRRLAVLRQTKMPAVLLELGFMTSPVEIKVLESPLTRREVTAALAAALMGKKPPPIVDLTPPADRPDLEKTIALTPEVMREVARVRRLDPDKMIAYAEAFEAALRIMGRNRVKYAKEAADLLAFGIHMADDTA